MTRLLLYNGDKDLFGRLPTNQFEGNFVLSCPAQFHAHSVTKMGACEKLLKVFYYCAFHKHANSKVQKPVSQLRFSLSSIIITITSNEP